MAKQHHCKPDHLYKVITKERGFLKTIKHSELTNDDMRKALEQRDRNYQVVSNAEAEMLAGKIIAKDREAAITHVLSQDDFTKLDVVMAEQLILDMQGRGHHQKAVDVAMKTAEKLTQAGQTIQAASMYGQLSPENVMVTAAKLAKKNNTDDRLTPEFTKELTEQAKKVQKTKGKNAKEIETAKLKAKLEELEEAGLLKKIATVQTMGHLLNPKTWIRNEVGNMIFAAAELPSDVIATAVDIAVSKVTGSKRTITAPRINQLIKGHIKGRKVGIRDALAGIDTSSKAGKYDIPQTRVFNPVGKKGVNKAVHQGLSKLETVLNIELRASDRAYYEMSFRESLANQLEVARINNKGKAINRITDEMVALAQHDALYKTFQDDSAAAKVFSGLKRALNINKDFGLGDIILKYPKTPGNLLSRGFAYSPSGYLKAMYQIARPFVGKHLEPTSNGKKPTDFSFNQREFVRNISRATTGTMGIMAFGTTLANLGLVTGEYGKDKDIEGLKKKTGIGPYRMNTSGLMRYAMTLDPAQAQAKEGDTWVSYDWAQPMAVPLAAAVNVALKGKETTASGKVLTGLQKGVEATFEGAETLTQQNLVKGLQDLFSARDDKGRSNIISGLENVLTSVPSSFVPTAFSQVNQLTDNTVRETYDPNPIKQAGNRALARIPGASKILPQRRDIYGEVMERYQDGSNNPLNVFINPAFVNKYKSTPVGAEVLSIYENTGETKQAPRVVPKTLRITNRQGKAEKIRLTGEQISKYQHRAGQQTKYIMDKMVKMPGFKRLSDESKADIMSSVMTDVHTAAKVKLFGHRPKRISKRAKAVLYGQSRRYMGALNKSIYKKLKTDRRAQ